MRAGARRRRNAAAAGGAAREEARNSSDDEGVGDVPPLQGEARGEGDERRGEQAAEAAAARHGKAAREERRLEKERAKDAEREQRETKARFAAQRNACEEPAFAPAGCKPRNSVQTRAHSRRGRRALHPMAS
jgi:hypothetical protein